MRNRNLRDGLLIAGVLLISCLLLALFSSPEEGGIAVVEQNGQEWGRYALDSQTEETVLTVGGEYNVRLLLESGAISFLSSDCPDHTCVRTGKLTKPGQAAVCLPARVSVRILTSSAQTDGFDGITG